MKLGADKLLLERGDQKVELDLMEVHEALIKIEREMPALGSDEETNRALLEKVKEWFLRDYELTLSTTEAWKVTQQIHFQWECFKKKFSLELVSHSGMDLTPVNCPMSLWQRMKLCCLFIWPRGRLKNVFLGQT